MKSPDSPAAESGRWTSLWVVALVSLVAQLYLCQFFSLGQTVPLSIDVNPSNLWKLGYTFPPTGSFQVLNWLGLPYLPQALNPLSLAAWLPSWWFFTTYVPVISTLALLAMAAFLRELEIGRPACLFSAVVYAWQGDILSFIYPGHYGYLTSWPFYAIAAWGALRAHRTGHWAYALISGACCGVMVGLLTNADRGGIASLLIAVLYLTPLLFAKEKGRALSHLLICIAAAAIIALAPLLALFKSNIAGVKIAGATDPEETYKLVTQYSLGPAETLTYLLPGFFGWHIHHPESVYWGWIGEWPDWPRKQEGAPNMNLAITTTGTIATVMALAGILVLLPGRLLGPDRFTDRQRLYGRVLLVIGALALVFSWGWHTGGLYRLLYHLPLMDKWRNPLKWLEITNFALIVLSSLGADHVIGTLRTDATTAQVRKRVGWLCALLLVALGLAIPAAFTFSIVLITLLQHEGFDPALINGTVDTMRLSILVGLMVVACASLVLMAAWRAEKLRQWRMINPLLQNLWQRMFDPRHVPLTVALAFALLAVAQLGWVGNQFLQPIPVHALTDSNPLLDTLRHEGDRVRVSVAVEDTTLNVLLQNQFAIMGISCIDISAASRIPDRIATFFSTLASDRARLLFLAGVKNVAVPQQDIEAMHHDAALAANIDHGDGYTIAPTSGPDVPSHALVVMKDYLAKATFVPGVEMFANDDDALKRLKDPAWAPRASLLLVKPVAITSSPAEGTSSTSDQVDIETYTPKEIDINAQASQGGYVLINDEYDPDWHVQVNGKDAPLLRADYLLRAVAVPAGASKITMHYAATYPVLGLSIPAVAVSLLSDGALLAAFLIAFLALRQNPSPRQ